MQYKKLYNMFWGYVSQLSKTVQMMVNLQWPDDGKTPVTSSVF